MCGHHQSLSSRIEGYRTICSQCIDPRLPAGRQCTWTSYPLVKCDATSFQKVDIDSSISLTFVLQAYLFVKVWIEFMVILFQVHTNETIGSVRQKIASKLKHLPDQVQIVANDKMGKMVRNLLMLVMYARHKLVCFTSQIATQLKSFATQMGKQFAVFLH